MVSVQWAHVSTRLGDRDSRLDRGQTDLILKGYAVGAGRVFVVRASPVLQHAFGVPTAHDAEARVVLHRHYWGAATVARSSEQKKGLWDLEKEIRVVSVSGVLASRVYSVVCSHMQRYPL